MRIPPLATGPCANGYVLPRLQRSTPSAASDVLRQKLSEWAARVGFEFEGCSFRAESNVTSADPYPKS